MPPPLLNAFTVDVEDYFQVSAFAGQVPISTWDHYQCRVVRNTEKILDLLDRRQTAGTFFILGWVAEKYPDLVRRIAAGGHAIGSHSHWHRLVYDLTPEEFRTDLRRSLDVLQGILGRAVRAYRAPSFSVIQRSLWALEILVDEGIELDSSIFPVHHDRYGIPDAKIEPFEVETSRGGLWEFPPTVWAWLKFNWPVGGGGYLRIYPERFTHFALTRVNREERAFQVYVHPWEVDPEQPRMRASFKSRLRHYTNLSSTESKLDSLLQRFRFGTLEQTLTEVRQRTATAGQLAADECATGSITEDLNTDDAATTDNSPRSRAGVQARSST